MEPVLGLCINSGPRKKYAPVGFCIYCGTDHYGLRDELGDEHIISQMIGGTAFLPESACLEHERIVSGIESRARICFASALPHFGIFDRGKKRDRRDKLAPYSLPIEGPPADKMSEWRSEKLKVSLDEHVGLINEVSYDGPRILDILSNSPFTQPECHILLVPDDGFFRTQKFGGISHRPVSIEDYTRFIAKLAYAFAVAELGYRRFTPCILEYILGSTDKHASFYFGRLEAAADPNGPLHQLSFYDHPLDRSHRWVVVRVRVFATEPTYTHLVVVGQR